MTFINKKTMKRRWRDETKPEFNMNHISLKYKLMRCDEMWPSKEIDVYLRFNMNIYIARRGEAIKCAIWRSSAELSWVELCCADEFLNDGLFTAYTVLLIIFLNLIIIQLLFIKLWNLKLQIDPTSIVAVNYIIFCAVYRK